MSKLLDARKEYMDKLILIEAKRKADIEARVQKYRMTLEATTPVETEESNKIRKVIAALDEVIAIESDVIANDYNTDAIEAEQVLTDEPTIAEDTEVCDAMPLPESESDFECDLNANNHNARPGMCEIKVPR